VRRNCHNGVPIQRRTIARQPAEAHRGRMARPLRINLPGQQTHVVQHGIGDARIFRDDDDMHEFLRLLGIELVRSGWTCLAYCLMTTHYHVVVQQPEPTLSTGFQHLNGRYAQEFNKRYARRGHVFEARFRARVIDTFEYRCEVMRYVHLNPTRALHIPPEDYPWSDYASTIGLRPRDPLVDPAIALAPFGRDLAVARRNYRAYVAERDPRIRRGWFRP
jgi:REP element-mobilizing transposase RayT